MTRSLLKLQARVAGSSQRRPEQGATMAEYGVLLAFIAMVAVAGVKALGTTLTDAFAGFGSAF